MKILNPAVTDDLRQGRPLALNLGAGMRARPGYYSVDHLELPGIDVVADLGAPLSALPDNHLGRAVAGRPEHSDHQEQSNGKTR